MKWLIIGEDNDVSVLDTEEMKDFLQHFMGNIRIYRICGIKNSPKEFYIHRIDSDDKLLHGCVTDFFGKLEFEY